jgi:RNA polymerase sigma-70 factor (ECF subfamily)
MKLFPVAMTDLDHPVPSFSAADRAHRFDREHLRRLRALAYRMLGSRAEAEDVVQEAWLRWAEVDERTVANAGAYLSRVVTHLCLDQLRSASSQREHYIGVWLPEPWLDDASSIDESPGPEQQAEFAQDVSVAFLLALERLSPLERAAFLLHDVFDLGYDEVARHLDRNEAACRQLISRARKRVKADYARREVAKEERQRLFDAFANAVRDRDVDALARVLAEDAVLLADGGGKVMAVPRPLHGGTTVARAFIGFARLPTSGGWRLEPARVNGLPGCLLFDDHDGGRLVQTIALAPSSTEMGLIGAIYVQRNPDKLGRVTNRLRDPS